MPDFLHLVARVLSAITGITLHAYGVENIGGQRESSDIIKAVLFALSAVSFGMNLVRLPRWGGYIIAAFHAVVLVYAVKLILDMTRYAFGESGGKQGVWLFYLPAGFFVIALLVSVTFNIVRPEEALRRK